MNAPKVIGVISEGTCRPQDVIPAMMSALEKLNPARLTTLKKEFPDVDFVAMDFEAMERDHADSELWQMLDDAINEELPEGFYFGTAVGDAACFGIWNFAERGRDTKTVIPKKSWVRRRYVSESAGFGKYTVYEYVGASCNRSVLSMVTKRGADRTAALLNDAIAHFIVDNELDVTP